jgi:type IV secretory pathway VirB2 component (pilin)
VTEPLTPLQEYYVGAIQLGLYVGGFVAVVGVFALGFVIARGLASWK